MSESKRTPVLGDHKRIKSKLVTPFNNAFGPMREVSWINMMIPELLWIALVQESWGPRRGVEIITSFTRDVRASDPTRDRTIWAAAGKFATLPGGVLSSIVKGRPYRDDLCGPLAPLNAHYPAHPMRELPNRPRESIGRKILGGSRHWFACYSIAHRRVPSWSKRPQHGSHSMPIGSRSRRVWHSLTFLGLRTTPKPSSHSGSPRRSARASTRCSVTST